MPHDARPPAMLITLTSRPVGIAMSADEGFEFVATDPDFELLDGSSFRRLEQLEQAAQSMARVVRGRNRSEMVAVPIPGSAMVTGNRTAAAQPSMPMDESLLSR